MQHQVLLRRFILPCAILFFGRFNPSNQTQALSLNQREMQVGGAGMCLGATVLVLGIYVYNRYVGAQAVDNKIKDTAITLLTTIHNEQEDRQKISKMTTKQIGNLFEKTAGEINEDLKNYKRENQFLLSIVVSMHLDELNNFAEQNRKDIEDGKDPTTYNITDNKQVVDKNGEVYKNFDSSSNSSLAFSNYLKRTKHQVNLKEAYEEYFARTGLEIKKKN